MDLHYLEYIIEIANMHSISRAAENLFITQSTLSQYLSRLEAELGVSLFERRRNEMTLTPAGKLYVNACEQMLQQKREPVLRRLPHHAKYCGRNQQPSGQPGHG